jgi:hypothetical protein
MRSVWTSYGEEDKADLETLTEWIRQRLRHIDWSRVPPETLLRIRQLLVDGTKEKGTP